MMATKSSNRHLHSQDCSSATQSTVDLLAVAFHLKLSVDSANSCSCCCDIVDTVSVDGLSCHRSHHTQTDGCSLADGTSF